MNRNRFIEITRITGTFSFENPSVSPVVFPVSQWLAEKIKSIGAKKGYKDSTVADSAKPEKSFSYSALGWCFQMSGIQKPCWLNSLGIILTNIAWMINDDYRGRC